MLTCAIAILLLALTNINGFKFKVKDAPRNCGTGHQLMGYAARKTFLIAHNEKRASLAKGEDKIGGRDLPGVKNMRFLAYNCSLEEKATELTKKCQRFRDRTAFTDTETNFAIIDSNKDNGVIKVAKKVVPEWWSQNSKWRNSQNITDDDYEAIPFFLMAQAETGEFGCSVNLCNIINDPFYTIACIYGRKVEVGDELYQEGDACTSCSYQCDEELCRKQ